MKKIKLIPAQYDQLEKNYSKEELDKIKNEIELVDVYNEDSISIGTVFSAEINFADGTEKGTYILVEKHLFNIGVDVVSAGGLVGSAILNKKSGQQFSTETPDGKEINGHIINILDKENAQRFLHGEKIEEIVK